MALGRAGVPFLVLGGTASACQCSLEEFLPLNCSLLTLGPVRELPKAEEGGGSAGVKEAADEGGGPAGVVDGLSSKLNRDFRA